jgi:5-methyltetrahydrofolate--homocysteine methyltransferase
VILHPLIQEFAPGTDDHGRRVGHPAPGARPSPGEAPDLWNLTHPKEVAAVARAYVEAGSEIILTNTFGANRIRLTESGGADRLKEINLAGVALSRKAAGKRALVFASIGPSGKLLTNGDVTEEELRAAFTEQAEALVLGGADGLVLETMQDLEEAKLAVAAAKATGLPVVASMVFDSGKDKDRTMMGTTPEQAAAASWRPARMPSAPIAARASPGS